MFQLVDTAPLAPGGCMICRGNKAPLLDLMQEFSAQQLRLYLCKTHYVQVARDAGLIEGDAHDELLRVRDTLAIKEREHGELADRFEALRQDMVGLLARHQSLEADRDREHQRGDQLQAQLDKVREDTMATLAATKEPEPDYEPALD